MACRGCRVVLVGCGGEAGRGLTCGRGAVGCCGRRGHHHRDRGGPGQGWAHDVGQPPDTVAIGPGGTVYVGDDGTATTDSATAAARPRRLSMRDPPREACSVS